MFDSIWHIFFWVALSLFILAELYLVLHLLVSDRDVTSIYSWLFVIILLPGIGLVIYMLFGRYKQEFNIRDKRSRQFISHDLENIFAPLRDKQKEYLKLIENKESALQESKIATLAQNNSNSLVTFNNELKVLQNGDRKFPELLEDLKSAKKFIHLEYYTWAYDELTKEVCEILKEKVQEGVEVRVLYDAIGSYAFSFHWRYIRSLRSAGIQIFPFLSIRNIHAWNYRNHRKIAVIDGEVGYVGGMNMGKENVDGGDMFKTWRDTHLRIEGDAVNLLQQSFAISWHITTGKSLKDKYFKNLSLDKTSGSPIQIVVSGPDAENEAIKQIYFGLITTATEKIYIQTPYFIPDTTMLEALVFAANAGIDVRLMITGEQIDVRMWGWAAMPYLRSIVEAGGKVYKYKKGYLHSKVLIADGCICSIGTANFDIRSFRIDYEISAVIYDGKVVQQLEKDFCKDIEVCEELTIEEFNQMSRLIKVRNGASKLLSPLL